MWCRCDSSGILCRYVATAKTQQLASSMGGTMCLGLAASWTLTFSSWQMGAKTSVAFMFLFSACITNVQIPSLPNEFTIFHPAFNFAGKTAGGWGTICSLWPFAPAVQSGSYGWRCLLSTSVLRHCCDGGTWHNHGHLLCLPLCFLHIMQNGLSWFIPL